MDQAIDSHVSVYITFPVPDHVDFKSSIPKFYEITKKTTSDLIYYGYAECGNNLMVQEGYRNAEAYLEHFGEVNKEFDALIEKVGKDKFQFLALGPKNQLELLKPRLSPLGCRFIVMEEDAMQLSPFPTSTPDKHFTFIAELDIAEEKLVEARAGLPAIKEATKNGEAAKFCYFYGFGEDNGQIIAREGYTDVSGFLEHMKDVQGVAKAVKAKFTLVGTKSDLDVIKSRDYLKNQDVTYWNLVDGAFWM